jgi:hypothetical protein
VWTHRKLFMVNYQFRVTKHVHTTHFASHLPYEWRQNNIQRPVSKTASEGFYRVAKHFAQRYKLLERYWSMQRCAIICELSQLSLCSFETFRMQTETSVATAVTQHCATACCSTVTTQIKLSIFMAHRQNSLQQWCNAEQRSRNSVWTDSVEVRNIRDAQWILSCNSICTSLHNIWDTTHSGLLYFSKDIMKMENQIRKEVR